MARTPLIAGNWKMNLNHLEAIALVQKLAFALPEKYYERVEVAVLPPFTDIRSVQTLIDGDRLKMVHGAQDLSPHVVRRLHRRRVGRDARQARLPLRRSPGTRSAGSSTARTTRWSTARCSAAVKHGIMPILCVGEGLAVREAGRHVEHSTAQLLGRARKVSSRARADAGRRLRAGVGDRHRAVASAADAQEVCAAIRQALAGKYGEEIAAGIRVLYGGSVKPGNVGEIVAQTDVDGALVGGASLDADEFAAAVRDRRRRPAALAA